MKIGFVSNSASCLSLIAQCAAREILPDSFSTEWFVLSPLTVHPLVKIVCRELGYPVDMNSPTVLTAAHLPKLDILISFDASVVNRWGALPGAPVILHWLISDPLDSGHQGQALLDKFKECTGEIKQLTRTHFLDTKFAELLNSKRKWSVFFESIQLGIAIHDRNRIFTYINQFAADILGYEPEEILGNDCHQLFPWKLCGTRCCFCDREYTQPESFWYHYNIERKDGQLRHVEMMVIPVKDTLGFIHGSMICFYDMTHRMPKAQTFSKLKQFMGIIGESPAMQEVFQTIQDVGPTDVSVLIQGDSGTGKELVAEALHKISKRAAKPFVVVNCGALPEGLLESELFGHVKGAFTGAIRDKKGRFEIANGGTIFLDEIGELSLLTQVKLLRVLESGTFERVGSERSIQVDVRVISATNRNLEQLIAKRLFREDLFYRICGFPIEIPPLKNRRQDIKLLLDYFLNKFALDIKKVTEYSKDFLDIIYQYDWPGNVRELQNVIQYAMIRCKNGRLEPIHLPPKFNRFIPHVNQRQKPGRPRTIGRNEVMEALQKTGGNKAKAARLLGISRATVYRILDKS